MGLVFGLVLELVWFFTRFKMVESSRVSFASLCMYWQWTGMMAKIQPYVVLTACFLVNLTVGSLYAIGNMIPYVVSYVRAQSHPKDLRLNTVTYMYASQAVGVGIAMVFGGLLDKYIGPRLVVLMGGLFMTIGALLSYVTIQFSFWWFMFTYGIITGIGLGLIYISPITCSMNWLPKWKGLASGVALSGIAFGTLIYSLAQTAYINPNNVRPRIDGAHHGHEKYFKDETVLRNVPPFFILLGISYAVVCIVGCVFMVNPSPVHLSRKKCDIPGLSPCEALKKFDFYILAFLLTIGQTISSFFNPLYKSFGLQEIDANDHSLTLLVIIGAFFNLLGRILWPLLSDLSSNPTAVVTQGAFLSTMLLTFYSTIFGGKVMYFIWVCCILFGIGGYVTLFPSAVVKIFGPRETSIIYGMMASFALTCGSILAGCLSQIMVNEIEWYGAFFVFGGLSCVYLITIMLYSCIPIKARTMILN